MSQRVEKTSSLPKLVVRPYKSSSKVETRLNDFVAEAIYLLKGEPKFAVKSLNMQACTVGKMLITCSMRS